jgi:hypothetical protein
MSKWDRSSLYRHIGQVNASVLVLADQMQIHAFGSSMLEGLFQTIPICSNSLASHQPISRRGEFKGNGSRRIRGVTGKCIRCEG